MRAKRTDTTHAAVRDELRRWGYEVFDCHDQGNGFPDLCVNARGVIVLLEVKTPGEKMTDKEREFHDKFATCPVYVVDSPEDALTCVRLREVSR